MLRAYEEMYLDSSTRILGSAFEYAVEALGMDIDEFADCFVQSDISKQFASGNPAYIAGINGFELVVKVLKKQDDVPLMPDYFEYPDKSPEYWCGYVAAYFQWYSDESFTRIFRATRASELRKMYDLYHEADIMRSVRKLEKNIKLRFPETRLAAMRKNLSLSQSELAILANVSIRQIQLFEQRQRDINSAQLITVYNLSKALGCRVEDLVER